MQILLHFQALLHYRVLQACTAGNKQPLCRIIAKLLVIGHCHIVLATSADLQPFLFTVYPDHQRQIKSNCKVTFSIQHNMTHLESSYIENIELASYVTIFPMAVGAILIYHKLPSALRWFWWTLFSSTWFPSARQFFSVKGSSTLCRLPAQ